MAKPSEKELNNFHFAFGVLCGVALTAFVPGYAAGGIALALVFWRLHPLFRAAAQTEGGS